MFRVHMLDVLGEDQPSFDNQATKTVRDEYYGSFLCLAKLNDKCQQIFKFRDERLGLGMPPVLHGRGIPICSHEAERSMILHGCALCLLMLRLRTPPHLHCIHMSAPSRRPRLQQRGGDRQAKRYVASFLRSKSCRDGH